MGVADASGFVAMACDEPVPDPWTALLHANGRIDLPGLAHQDKRWCWHCAPLAEWDGTVPPAWG